MTAKTAAALKAQYLGVDPLDMNNDLVDSAMQASTTSGSGQVELATSAETITGTDAVRAVTPAGLRADLAKFKHLSCNGHNGAGACTLTGAVVGDIVIGVAGITSGSVGGAKASFESTITVVDQIQQSSASDLSAKIYTVDLLAVA